MKQRSSARFFLIIMIVFAAAGFFLRRFERAGAGAGWLIGISVAAALACLAVSVTRKPCAAFAAMFPPSKIDGAAGVAASVLLAVGGFLMLVQSAGFARLIGGVAILAGACLAMASLTRARGKMPKVGLYVVVVLFYVVKLFYDFRRWTVDPAVLDYCFWLFAAICFMLATFHAAQFCFDLGRRRVLTFFALMGIYFGAVSLADLRGGEALLCGGGTLWMLACAWQALRADEYGKDGDE